MWFLVLSLLLGSRAPAPLFPQAAGSPLPFELRTNANLLFGKGVRTGADYYDVIVTRQPASSVFVKLPYTSKGGKFSFDLHHRIAMTPDFELPAEITTEVQIMTGGTNT